ncbi:MAG: DUF2306 domain-containing protein [Sphingopyxis solisilvae]|uniref:DUF2306 domain-containing protein n=1 Tax=Sphingopyxis solisilvae TaxID=1886788 RepID=UPI0040373958
MTSIARTNFATLRPHFRRVLLTVLMIAGVTGLAVLIRLLWDAPSTYRTPAWAIWVHLATVIPALPLGAWLLWRPVKGDAAHRIGGRIWVLLMIVTAIDSFWIRTLTGTIGPIHIFSILVLVQLPRAILFAKSGQVERHVKTMRGVYFGLLAAGFFSLAPGRALWMLLFG